MGKSMFPSDSISLKASTGGNSAGNGGDGYNKGDITNKPSVEFNPSNKAEGADVHVKNGDHVSQKAYWDAGGANAKAEGTAKSKGMESYGHKKSDAKADNDTKAEGGKANSNGDQESDSGHNKSDVEANTHADQDNWLLVEQGQEAYAGVGGNGGDENYAVGGDVDIKASIESANLNDVLNHSKYFDADLHL
jgi:hypothetical protein